MPSFAVRLGELLEAATPSEIQDAARLLIAAPIIPPEPPPLPPTIWLDVDAWIAPGQGRLTVSARGMVEVHLEGIRDGRPLGSSRVVRVADGAAVVVWQLDRPGDRVRATSPDRRVGVDSPRAAPAVPPPQP